MLCTILVIVLLMVNVGFGYITIWLPYLNTPPWTLHYQNQTKKNWTGLNWKIQLQFRLSRMDKLQKPVMILTFPHSFSLYTLCMLLPHAYYSLFTFLFPSTDFLSFHVLPYCFYIASCTVHLLMHSPAQSCTVCLLMHSLFRCSLITQYIRTG